jgi:hypothetical protein
MKNSNLDANASIHTSTPIGWYKWYPRDFLASSTVRRMSITAQGMYRCLLDLQWEDGFVPVDYAEACFIIRANEQEAESFRPFFEKCFPNGINRRMAEIRQQAIDDREQQIRAGKKSAEARMKSGKAEPESNSGSMAVQPDTNSGSTAVQMRWVNHAPQTVLLGSKSNDLPTDVQRPFNECSTPVQRPFNDRSNDLPTENQHPFNETETETKAEAETIKVKKDADAPSSRKGKVDYHSLAQEAGFEDDMFLKAWSEFAEHRREIKHPMSERAANLILSKLKKFSVEVGVEAINRSISSGWRDVFPEKATQRVGVKGRPSRMGSALEYMASNRDNVQEPEYFNAEFKEIILKRQKALEGK